MFSGLMGFWFLSPTDILSPESKAITVESHTLFHSKCEPNLFSFLVRFCTWYSVSVLGSRCSLTHLIFIPLLLLIPSTPRCHTSGTLMLQALPWPCHRLSNRVLIRHRVPSKIEEAHYAGALIAQADWTQRAQPWWTGEDGRVLWDDPHLLGVLAMSCFSSETVRYSDIFERQFWEHLVRVHSCYCCLWSP